MKIKIAICEDEEIIRKQLVNTITEYFSLKNIDIELFEYSNGYSLLKECSKYIFSFIFLDIDLGEQNGVEIAKMIRKIQTNPVNIVFVTSYAEYQTKVLSIHTFDYLLKPINKKEIHKVLDDLMFWYNSETSNLKERVTFKTINGLIIIYIDDLLYFEYNNRRIDIVTKTHIYHMYDKIKSIVSKMNKYDFVSPHAAYVINLKEVSQYIKSENRIIMTNGKNIPISQLKTKKFKEEYLNHINKTWERK